MKKYLILFLLTTSFLQEVSTCWDIFDNPTELLAFEEGEAIEDSKQEISKDKIVAVCDYAFGAIYASPIKYSNIPSSLPKQCRDISSPPPELI